MVITCDNAFPNNTKYDEYFNKFADFPLSNFQKWAIKGIIDNDNVLITAHTGSGKTLPAEFMINYYTEMAELGGEKRKKIIYASPIKALSNQKLYDMRRKFPKISFGLLTGDCKDNPGADVLIMTTEILRNTLFNKKIMQNSEDKVDIPLSFEIDIDTELAGVVFDEVHYIGDADRGSVWEQSILLLPPQVQILMLSATIDRPDEFAGWIETEKNKQALAINLPKKNMILAPTYERVVPLTHYMWLSTHNHLLKNAKDTPYEQKIENLQRKPIVIKEANGTFMEKNYHKVHDLTEYMKNNRVFVKRQFVLNDIVKYLNKNDMLPAICFVFSRKHVELAAKEINFSLFEEGSKIPATIGDECKKILMSKLPNYEEYINLPEYQEIVRLLEKGIAIHHAGIISVLREMVEMLFEKKYIKLLFATETFAVGINMPTKTVIFSGLTKFDGNGMRPLLSHEYTQMAGRAGRRGIDDVGHVFHCNNLFDLDNVTEYKNMLCGAPQTLTSKFKVSFGLALNIIASGNTDNSQIANFVSQSLLSQDINKEVEQYDKNAKKLEEEFNIKSDTIKLIKKTPNDIIEEYNEKFQLWQKATNKQKKKLKRELTLMEENNRFLKADIEKYKMLEESKKSIEENQRYKTNAVEYLNAAIDSTLNYLEEEQFITTDTADKKSLTNIGTIASQCQETHPLVMAKILTNSKFKLMTPIEIAGFISCFTNIKVKEEIQAYRPVTASNIVNEITTLADEYIKKYGNMENQYGIYTGENYEINFDIQQQIINWCNAENEEECKEIINELKIEKKLFLGDLVKAILKINNIVTEIENICETTQDIALLEKIKQIPSLTLKYVATNQSLYI
jgi:superfamily II RNA helicase